MELLCVVLNTDVILIPNISCVVIITRDFVVTVLARLNRVEARSWKLTLVNSVTLRFTGPGRHPVSHLAHFDRKYNILIQRIRWKKFI